MPYGRERASAQAVPANRPGPTHTDKQEPRSGVNLIGSRLMHLMQNPLPPRISLRARLAVAGLTRADGLLASLFRHRYGD